MPFVSAAQELAMMLSAPEVYKKWKLKYGDYPGFKEYLSKVRKNHNRRVKGTKTKNSRKTNRRRKHR
jgi:hypothetical protein